MTTQTNNASEVANLLALIVSEYEAAERGLTGYAETARHAQITARMETMGKYVDALGSLMPPGQQAMELVVLALEHGGAMQCSETSGIISGKCCKEGYR